MRGFRKFTAINNRGFPIYIPETLKRPGELDNWPTCVRCNYAVEAVEFGEKNNKYCEIVCICTHGSGVRRRENVEAVRITWPDGQPPNDEEYRHLIRDLRCFGGEGVVSSRDKDPV